MFFACPLQWVVIITEYMLHIQSALNVINNRPRIDYLFEYIFHFIVIQLGNSYVAVLFWYLFILLKREYYFK